MTSACSRFRSGQSAFEFMFIFGVLLSAVALGMWVSGTKTGEVAQETRRLEIDDFLSTLTEKINTAWIEGEGFSANVTLPERIAGADYTLNISSGYITLFIGDDHFMRQTIAANITGALGKGVTSTLTNTGSGIVVSPAS